MWALGLMSGTSLDGIDAALIETDGERVTDFGPWLTVPYADSLRAGLRAALGRTDPLPALEAELTEAHARAVRALLAMSDIRPEVVGFHGHTIDHRPERRHTRQLGDGAMLEDLTGLPVVWDLRQADVAAGGQGAPLAPAYHAALARDLERPLAVLNMGGVGNVTFIGADGAVLAFDTGPANAPLDDWCRLHADAAFDADGRLARRGRVVEARVQDALDHPYFNRPPPKSLDRQDFTSAAAQGLEPADGAATLVEITAASAARALEHLPARPARWLVTGGGRHNGYLMERLAERLAAPVAPVEAVGWDGDAIEAQAFAFLAVRSLQGLPITFPGTTGAPQPMSGGRRVA